jgi:uncharacterized protein (DUF4415 family)
MPTKKKSPRRAWIGLDEPPAQVRAWFKSAEYCKPGKLGQRGRPKSGATKAAVSLRLDPDVIGHYRASGPGWQSRINDDLRKAAKLKARG